MNKTIEHQDSESGDRLSSEDLAALIVDGLLRAGIMQPENVQQAIKIAAEEIEVRKTLGDY
jgi:hypothetical protein